MKNKFYDKIKWLENIGKKEGINTTISNKQILILSTITIFTVYLLLSSLRRELSGAVFISHSKAFIN